jgi:hypothetical protein
MELGQVDGERFNYLAIRCEFCLSQVRSKTGSCLDALGGIMTQQASHSKEHVMLEVPIDMVKEIEKKFAAGVTPFAESTGVGCSKSNGGWVCDRRDEDRPCQ